MAVGSLVHSFIKPASSVLSTQDTAVVSQGVPALQHRKKMNTDHFMFYEGYKDGVIGVLYYRQGSSIEGFPHGSVGKSSACNAGDPGMIPGSRKSPGEENGYPLQYSCLENSMERGDWRAIVHGISRRQM